MTFRSILLSISVFIFAFSQITSAQSSSSNHFLKQIGLADSLYSKVLGESRTIYIQFPEAYNPESKQKYPVAFILDGEIQLPTLNVVHNSYSGGYFPEMILIGIANDKNRIRDLTTSTVTNLYGMPFDGESGKAESFTKFIETELIPFVEKKYPVTNYRTLIGHSYGGLFTVYTLIHHPELFANYLAIDPSLDWDKQKLITESKEILSKKSFKNKALFITLSGQLHMQDYTITIDNVMQDSSDFTIFPRSNVMFSNLVRANEKNGLSFGWKFYQNDLHGTVPLPSMLDGLISMFTWYQWENTDKINSPETPIEELRAIVNHRYKKLKEHFGYDEPAYPEELLNVSGYMNMDMQQFDKSKMYFEFALQFYPNSANAHDSMAEFYESRGDIKNAINFAEKAFKINGSDYFKKRLDSLKKKK